MGSGELIWPASSACLQIPSRTSCGAALGNTSPSTSVRLPNAHRSVTVLGEVKNDVHQIRSDLIADDGLRYHSDSAHTADRLPRSDAGVRVRCPRPELPLCVGLRAPFPV